MEAEADLTENYDHLFKVSTVYPLVAFSSLCFFSVMFEFVSPYWSKRNFPEYSILSLSQKADWDSRVGAILHSLVVTPLSFYVIFWDEAVSEDPVWGHSVTARTAMAITEGFMLADFFIIWRYFSWKDTIVFSCHHIATLYPYTYNVLYGPMPFLGCYMLFTEGSSPFVNLRWFLHTLKRTDSDLYFYNGLIMVIAFFLLRIVPLIPYWIAVYRIFTTHPMPGINTHMKNSLILGSLALWTLNVYWFRKMLLGGRKVIQRRNQRRQEEASKDKRS